MMEFEETSFKNLVWFYREELRLIDIDPGNASILSDWMRMAMIRKGVLVTCFDGCSPYSKLTGKAKNVLESIDL